MQSVPVSRSVRPCSAQDVTGSERVCAGQRNGSEPEGNERRGPFHVSSEGDCCAARIYPHTRGPRHEGLKGGASQACAGGVGCLSACSAVRERTASRHALALTRWAASRAIGTEDTAIADLGFQRLVTPGALVEVNASIGRHRFDPPMTAEWTRDCGFRDHRPRRKVWHLPNGPRCSCGLPLLAPQAHDRRDHEQLHEPVACMNGSHLPRDVLPEDRPREQNHGKPDPQEQAHVHRAQPAVGTEQG